MNTSQTTTYSAVLGAVLASHRQIKGLEQGEMAERMGLSQPSYSRLETGASTFSVDQMYQAARALGVSGEEISSTLNNYIANLRANGTDVVPMPRGHKAKAGQDGVDVGAMVFGAALGALIMGLAGRK